MHGLYYIAPSDASFRDMKECALEIWRSYESEPYRNEKVQAIEHIENVSDNFMYMFAMFDHRNMRRVWEMLKPSTQADLRARLIDGGSDLELDYPYMLHPYKV